MHDLAETNVQLAVVIDDLRDQLVHAKEEKANVEGQVARLVEDLSAARDETTAERRAGEEARIELIKLQMCVETLAPLESELRDTRRHGEGLRAASTRFERTVEVLEVQRLALDSQIQSLNVQLEGSRVAEQKTAQKLETVSELLDRERAARTAAERDLAVLHAIQAKRKTIGNPRRKRDSLQTS